MQRPPAEPGIIALEGLDGCGKTMQAATLLARLSSRGIPASAHKEPGDTPTGRYLTRLLRAGTRPHPIAAAGLFLAAHAEVMQQLVQPDLDAGRTVIMDRFTPSCIAYQCYRDGVPERPMVHLHRHLQPDHLPISYIFLDLDPVTSVARSATLPNLHDDHNELATVEDRTRTRHGYLAQIRRQPHLWTTIDANDCPDAIADQLLTHSLHFVHRPTHTTSAQQETLY